MTSQAHPVIEARGLHKHYATGASDVHALKGVDLEVSPGDYVAIMGPSGSGKSTMMNLIGCLDTPSEGRCAIDGEDTADMDAAALAQLRNRKIGFVFQNFNLLGRTSAFDNVALPLMYSEVEEEQKEARVRDRLTRVGLGERMDHTPAQLSGGQQQRVAIARALVNDPVLVLADEPTGALDSKTGEEILTLFQELNESGITIIMVTHELDVAEHAKRIIHMRDGEIIDDAANSNRRMASVAAANDPSQEPTQETGS